MTLPTSSAMTTNEIKVCDLSPRLFHIVVTITNNADYDLEVTTRFSISYYGGDGSWTFPTPYGEPHTTTIPAGETTTVRQQVTGLVGWVNFQASVTAEGTNGDATSQTMLWLYFIGFKGKPLE